MFYFSSKSDIIAVSWPATPVSIRFKKEIRLKKGYAL